MASAAALGVPALRFPLARAQPFGDDVQVLEDDLYVVTAGGTNVVALTGADGVALVDGGSADVSADLLQTVAALPEAGAVHTLFNTCWHPTQTGSNATLGEAGATIIAHENTRLWLTQDITWPWDGSRFAPLSEAARPNKTFYKKEALEVGGRLIEYGHVRSCPHTDGDIYVRFPHANVVAVGDAVSKEWPSIDWWTGGWLGGIVGALELFLVISDDGTRFVPARGPLLERADIERQHQMYDLLYERFVRLLYDGKSPEEAVAARPAAEFEEMMGPSEEFVERAFQSLWGYLAPDA